MVQLDSEQTTLQSTSDVPANDNTTQNMEHAETDASRLKRVDEYELMTDEKAQNSGLCSDPYGSWRCVSLIVLMVCFIVATPLSLALTIPAYVLADRAEMAAQRSFRRQTHSLWLASFLLDMLAAVAAVVCASVALTVYISVEPQE